MLVDMMVQKERTRWMRSYMLKVIGDQRCIFEFTRYNNCAPVKGIRLHLTLNTIYIRLKRSGYEFKVFSKIS